MTLGAARGGRTCSDSSVLRRGEEVALWHGDGSQAQDADHDQVDEAGLRRAVEGVVEPGHEGAHDEEGDAAVVQPAHANTHAEVEKKQLGGGLPTRLLESRSLLNKIDLWPHLTCMGF